MLSLGRGTDKPFSSLGAPHLDTTKLLKSLGTIQVISAAPLTFTPQSSVFQNKTCQGIEFQITNLKNVQSYDLGLQLISALSKIDPDFQWVQNKEKGSYWIDALLGSSDFRLSL